MNISFTWLKDYIKHDMQPQELADALTSCGLEVEAIEEKESIPGGLKGLVVGEVLESWKHPNADKLTLTKVDLGGGQVNQIVCGAPNVAAGQKVIVAVPGTMVYPLKGEPFEIKKAKIRGESSHGMICAEDEIGLGEGHDGIMVLEAGVPNGTTAADHFNMKSDLMMTIGLTPNRPDAASHIGVARDLSALIMTRQGEKAEVMWPDVSAFSEVAVDPEINIELQSTDVIRYTGVHIANIKVSESPDWLKHRLISVGLNPINNIVDITNFVQYEMGQPLHAFDADKIAGKKVVVRNSKSNEKFVTLDEVERKLDGTELMICDADKGMCIAGVFGGLISGVTASTTNIFMESACFDPTSIRKTSKNHGLKTDASFRYERGTDPNITVTALKRAALLFSEVAGGKVSSSIIDLYPSPIEDFSVSVSLDRMNMLNGIELGESDFEKVMTSLEIKFAKTGSGYELTVPPYRVDVQREADIAEELLRLTGYDNIPVPDQMRMSVPAISKLVPDQIRNKISNHLAANGFSEVMNNSLTRSSLSNKFNEAENNAVIKNPLSKELDILRQNMLFPLLDTAIYNANRKRSDLRLFEKGFCYKFIDGKYVESEKIALLITGDRQIESWMENKENYSIFYLKSIIMNTLCSAGLAEGSISFEPISDQHFQMCMQVKYNGTTLGMLGMVKSSTQKNFDLKGNVWFGEFLMSPIYKKLKKRTVAILEPPKFPEVKRDLSMVLDQKVAYASLESLAFNTEKKILRRVELFDVYQGDKIEAGKKSYALSFYLRDDERTLKDKDIDKVMDKLMSGFEKQLNAIVRKS